jgi:hypothetical protein
MSDVINLPRYRRGIAMLDAAALMGAGPMTESDLRAAREEPMPTKPAATKPTSVRLRPEQVETLDRLAPVLTALRPDLAALAGGELGQYSLLRLAIALGLAELERMAGLDALRREHGLPPRRTRPPTPAEAGRVDAMTFETIGQTFNSYDAALAALVAEYFGDAGVPAGADPAAEAAQITAAGWLSAFTEAHGAPADGAVAGIVAELAGL